LNKFLLKNSFLFTAVLWVMMGSVLAQDFASQADVYMKERMTREQFTGSVLVARNGRILFERGYSLANREWAIPNTPQTRFRIASLTKQFTAAAILLLQQQHKLSVQEPASQYISDLPVAWQKITIHQLLTHTSGIANYTDSAEVEKLNLLGTTPRQLINLVKDLPLPFPPGTKMVYCNTGYVLLGMLIEKVSGLSYGEFLRKNIFEPLQMQDTGYDLAEQILPRRAAGYAVQNGVWLNAPRVDASVPFSAGGLYSTVEDLFKWNEALMGNRLLSEDSRRQMFTKYPEASGYGGQYYGYGIVLTEKFGQTQWYHGGGIRGFSSAIQRYSQSQICVVVLANFEDIKSWEVATGLAALLIDQPIKPAKSH
jgi:CubicO group peptidase (beta-lactamase class C family)